jgi:hypothetical protein
MLERDSRDKKLFKSLGKILEPITDFESAPSSLIEYYEGFVEAWQRRFLD